MLIQRVRDTINAENTVGADLLIVPPNTELRGPIVRVDEPSDSDGVMLHTEWLAKKDVSNPRRYSMWSLGRTVGLNHFQLVRIQKHGAYGAYRNLVRYDDRSRRYESLGYSIGPQEGVKAHLRPHQVEGMPVSLAERSTWEFPKVELDEEAWQTVINMPIIFGNDVPLRDTLVQAQSQEGYFLPAEQAGMALVGRQGYSDHFPKMAQINPIVNKIVDQLLEQQVELPSWVEGRGWGSK